MENKKKIIILIMLGILISTVLIIFGLFFLKNNKTTTRADKAQKITNCFPKSCQNPVFSPDDKYLIFTRFNNGYNQGPAEIVKINLETKEEKVIVNLEGDNVNVPYGSWVDSKIVFAAESGIATANNDGTNIQFQLNNNKESYYIEPVFNPTNTNQIVLEAVKNNQHQIKLLELDKKNRLTDLTDASFDDRLPSWSSDGKKILWQRNEIGKDNWQIITADIILEDKPHLENIITLTQGPDDTDNSWTWDGKFILSSRTGNGKIPNIFAYSLENKNFQRITQSENEDGAPSSSHDSKYIAFESHQNQDEESPTEIWLIASALSKDYAWESSSVPSEKLKNVKTYANSYIDYTPEDMEKLKKFDIIMIEPYNMKKEWLKELKTAGVVIIAYISVGEADNERRYWKNWQPTEKAYNIDSIPRTKIDQKDSIFIGPDPGWPGSYFVDATNEQWQKIILEQEIPYILALGDGLYDGLVMDLIDVVDEYEGLPREQEMRAGMVELIKKIKQKYPDKIIIPNRGFGILEEMGPYIDAFKFEELTLKYNNIPGQADFEKYNTQLDSSGNHQNQEQIDQAVNFAKKYNRPIFVLDHVETEPSNNSSAKLGYKEAQKLSQKYGVRFIWFANSVDQDLPVWQF